ncbi:RNA-binding ATPase activator esf2 [Basidiobolus ranarum]|uniref:18S rRNA factor 2 n=1 Tax=Basidiobolus ranarum TaxID=34480 RepID=A0ABR2VWY4_9FUNG
MVKGKSVKNSASAKKKQLVEEKTAQQKQDFASIYNLEEEEEESDASIDDNESKSKQIPSRKNVNTDSESEEWSENEESDIEEEAQDIELELENASGSEVDEEGEEEEEEDADGQEGESGSNESSHTSPISTEVPSKKINKKKVVKPISKEELELFQKAADKTGLVYLSTIPPFMKPQKIRHLLSKFGEIGRIYLAPEDHKIYQRRKKYGGNKKKKFTEGWAEFKDKKFAKIAAFSLNGNIIGGKKGSYYYDDIWNIKYLPKFKWNHLTERIAYEKAIREQKLRAEISQARKENKMYVDNVEKAKVIKGIQDKKKRKLDEGDVVPIKRTFKQREMKTKEVLED